MRLSMSSFAGMARTLVAVGTDSERSMLAAVRAAAPRSLISSAPLGTGVAGCLGLSVGTLSVAGLEGAGAALGGAFAGAGAVTVPFPASLAGVRPGP
jgi:hypothetical protein